MEELFNVGKIVNTHALKGEVKVMVLTSDVNNFKRYKKVLVKDEWRKIEGIKFQNDRVILKLEGINSIDEAEKFKNSYIQVLRSEEPDLEEGENYICDIVGCEVFDQDNNNLGEVFEVLSTKNNDVLWIKKPKELLIPILKDIVFNIDVENKKIDIKNVKEWLDED